MKLYIIVKHTNPQTALYFALTFTYFHCEGWVFVKDFLVFCQGFACYAIYLFGSCSYAGCFHDFFCGTQNNYALYPNSICFLSIKCACHTVLSFLVDFLDSQSNLRRTIVHKRVRMRKRKEERFYGPIRTCYTICGRSSGGFEGRL